ncbi:MAG: hypothetical protein LBT05_03070 [Planctomycetaceae bacterium]|jgi:hypothetical protein|nr:hypothetical protein [Planctomycetaceae bacterium]
MINQILKKEKFIHKIALLILLSSSHVFFANDSFVDRNELHNLWIQYLQKIGNTQGDVSWSYSKNGKIRDEGTKSVCFHYPCVAREASYNAPKNVGVSGPSYQFHLFTDDKNNLPDWSIESIRPISPEEKKLNKKLYFPSISATDLLANPYDPIGNGICGDLGVAFLLDEHLYLPSFILQDEFVVTQCEKISSDELEDAIKINFSFFSNDTKNFLH